ncbi:MAG: acylneuraminate cytidylyltransferase family protein [Prevotellaceae bacterium]|nr:acylneuraminate cytidylyltransferase family protein [Prevotellaceae bacterium]MDY3365229.1 acylneuraminate cytidylyltransferase family protein [Prevotella sp.]
MKSLIIIPARGGSKGIPGKNIKELAGKPLLNYTIELARKLAADEDICLSTDDLDIVNVAESCGLKVPFLRPANLATDYIGTYEVLLHALNFYEEQGHFYEKIILLQNTSPFRKKEQVEEALRLYTPEIDMVVSVKEVTANPYYNCFEEDGNGFLQISKGSGDFIRRQDVPKAYEYNGAIYIINPASLKEKTLGKFTKRVKYVMDEISSVDLDTMTDWMYAEFLIKEKLVEL